MNKDDLKTVREAYDDWRDKQDGSFNSRDVWNAAVEALSILDREAPKERDAFGDDVNGPEYDVYSSESGVHETPNSAGVDSLVEALEKIVKCWKNAPCQCVDIGDGQGTVDPCYACYTGTIADKALSSMRKGE